VLNVAETAAEVDLRGLTEMLAGEDQHRMGEEGPLNVGPSRVVKVGKLNTSDDGAERGSSRSNRECHASFSCVYIDNLIALGDSQQGIQRDRDGVLARHSATFPSGVALLCRAKYNVFSQGGSGKHRARQPIWGWLRLNVKGCDEDDNFQGRVFYAKKSRIVIKLATMRKTSCACGALFYLYIVSLLSICS
jgi:hypothetical protein